MIFTLETLRARHGDSLLLHWGEADNPRLIIIDGGPSGVYRDSLKPRLEQLRDSRTPDASLPVEMLMVSHIDDDHIRGVLDLTRELRRQRENGEAPAYDILTLWNNSFDDVISNSAEELFGALGDDSESAAAAAAAGEAPPGFPFSQPTAAVVASVRQGRTLRDDAERLSLQVNTPFAPLVVAPDQGRRTLDLGDGLVFTILGPAAQRVRELQEEWDRQIERLGLAEDQAAEAAAYLDSSVFNLASLVVLAEAGGKRILLTGDARGDHILEGIEAADLFGDDGKLHVDILKLPHHGSDRNVDVDFFQKITADHYVVSGNGRHHNPEVETFRLLSEGREDDDFTLHLTFEEERLAPFFEEERAAGREYRVEFRDPEALSIPLHLGEPLGD